MTQKFHCPLSIPDQALLGISDPRAVARADQVHHDECDALNHVNNTSYLVWFERLRIRFMEHYELGSLTDANGPRIVIHSGQIQWLGETFRDEIYVVTTGCTAIRTSSMTLEQSVWVDGQKRASFTCVMVIMTPDGSKKMPIPHHARSKLLSDGARQE